MDLVRTHWRIENNSFERLNIERKDNYGRWVHCGNGLPVVSLLRIVASILPEMLYAVHLRAETTQATGVATTTRLGARCPDFARGREAGPSRKISHRALPHPPCRSCRPISSLRSHPVGERRDCAYLTRPWRSEVRDRVCSHELLGAPAPLNRPCDP